MSTIRFNAQLTAINTWTIVHIPMEESSKLPSRGMVMGKGTLNGVPFLAPLEPDGLKSHWFRVEDDLLKKAHIKAGNTVAIEVEAADEWLEPEVPQDIHEALSKNAQILDLWEDITPSARWDWIRWIRATKNPETRKKRIEVAVSKMKSGKRRPCCFNRNMCTEMSICPSGVLPQPNQ